MARSIDTSVSVRLKAEMTRCELHQAALARAVCDKFNLEPNTTQVTVNQLLHGKRALVAKWAIILSEVFPLSTMSPESWMKLQMNDDLADATAWVDGVRITLDEVAT